MLINFKLFDFTYEMSAIVFSDNDQWFDLSNKPDRSAFIPFLVIKTKILISFIDRSIMLKTFKPRHSDDCGPNSRGQKALCYGANP